MVSGAVSATVLQRGAELCSMRDATGRELIWQAGPVWPSHAPVLFPIIGELNGGHLLVDGRRYAMRRHGFVRARTLRWASREAASCTLVLEDDAETRAMFPFAFRLEVAYTLDAGALTIAGTVTNTGGSTLPCSIGFHPAFNWPLSGTSKSGHRIELSAAEADTIGQLNEAGLVARRVPSPLVGGRVAELSEALFAHDALVFDPLHSDGARYVAPDGTSLRLTWEGARQLGIWSKPGDFVCIEPWHGVASPVAFDGEFRDKPGLMHLAPGEHGTLRMTIQS